MILNWDIMEMQKEYNRRVNLRDILSIYGNNSVDLRSISYSNNRNENNFQKIPNESRIPDNL